MIGIARNALFALVACLICLEPLAAQAPAVIDAAPATGARLLRGHHAVARRDRLDARAGRGRGIDDRGRLRRERLEADQACEEDK